jgi:hypothetical protein
MPTPPLNDGFGPEDTSRTTASAPTRRVEMSGGLSNAAMTDHVGGNDPAGPNVGDWLDAPGPGQEIDVADVMITLHEASVKLRTAMHEAQQVERDAQVTAMHSEATDIRNSAGFSFAAAVVAGAFQIGGGALDIGGSFHAYKTAFPEGESAPATKVTDETEDETGSGTKAVGSEGDSDPDVDGDEPPGKGDPTQKLDKSFQDKMKEAQDKAAKERKEELEERTFKRNSLKADILLKRYTGAGQAMGGVGQIISGGLEFGSHQQDATEKDDEAEATKDAARVEDQDNLLKNIDDLISGVRQTFSQMIEAKNEAMNKITQA